VLYWCSGLEEMQYEVASIWFTTPYEAEIDFTDVGDIFFINELDIEGIGWRNNYPINNLQI